VLGVLGALGLATTQCSDPAPLGEALLVIQTDVAIPRRVDRVRIDVLAADGAVIQSRELSTPSPADWPLSFSVVGDAEAPRSVLVRVRAFLDGHTVERRELAARGAAPWVDPAVPPNLTDACRDAPSLALSRPLTLRRGDVPITTVLPYASGATVACNDETLTGSAVARLEVTEAARYQLEVTQTIPDGARGEPGGSVTLAVRRECLFATTQIACADGLSPIGVDLTAGVYWLVTGGAAPAPADVTLRASRVDAIVPASEPPVPAPSQRDELEPAPGMTIDRLVAVDLVPGTRGTLDLVLRGECFGTEADLAKRESCVDRAGLRAPVVPVVASGALQRERARVPPWQADEAQPCTATPRAAGPLLDEEVCVPGGVFALGDTLALTDLAYRTQPERMRVVSPFLVDVHEMTVGRYRDAVRRGFVPPVPPARNEGPLVPGPSPPRNVCTFSQGATPDVLALGVGDSREKFPLNCVTWATARALCQYLGGDLLHEDQWEYAATAAGREVEMPYPWGADLPTCDRTVYERAPAPPSNRCAPQFGPVAVDDPSLAGDVTLGGVRAMAGNIQEWLLDGFLPYASNGWAASGLRGAPPLQSAAPLRSTRGADWLTFGLFATGSARRAQPVTAIYDDVGFRCARPGR